MNPLRIAPSLPMTLDGTTAAQRREMPRKELVRLMGPLHVHHADYRPRPHVPVHVPNMAHRMPMIERDTEGFLHLLTVFARWALR